MELRLIIKALVQRFNSSFKLFSHILTCVRRYLLFFIPSVVFFKEYMIDAWVLPRYLLILVIEKSRYLLRRYTSTSLASTNS